MSEIFEGIVLPIQASKQWSASLTESGHLSVADIGAGAGLLFRADYRGSSAFSAEIDRLGAEASLVCGKALVVRYDSRIGHRSSKLYAGGSLAAAFDEHSELFVPLDGAGYPVADARPIMASERIAGEEYETAKNAIQMGLKELACGSWEALFDAMTQPG